MIADLKMKSWIKMHLDGKQKQRILIDTSSFEACYIIGVFSLSKEQLNIIGQFQFQQQNSQFLAYLSYPFQFNKRLYRIIYIPHNKTEMESVHHLTQIVREVSDIVISDTSCGLSHMREIKQLQNRQFVVVNGNQLYQMGLGKQSIELVKQVKTPYLTQNYSSQAEDSMKAMVKVQDLSNAIQKYTEDWLMLKRKQQSWKDISIKTSIYYEMKKLLEQKNQNFSLLVKQNKKLSSLQLQCLREQLIHTAQDYENQIVKAVACQIIQQVKALNQTKTLNFLKGLQNKILQKQIDKFESLQSYKGQIFEQLQLYNTNSQFIDFILFPSLKEIFKSQIDQLQAKNINLHQIVANLEQKISQKNQQLTQYKLQLQLYSDKIANLFNLQNTMSVKDSQIDSLVFSNQQLKNQLSSSKNQQTNLLKQNNQLKQQIERLSQDNKQMFDYLQQFTKERITLHGRIEAIKSQTVEMKAQIINANQFQARALRSIQNEAQIKTRLTRYEQYVKEMNMAIESFKKLESDKFNYILRHNYKQYQELKNQHVQLQQLFQKELAKNKELGKILNEQKVRMSYYQKFIMNNYPNQPIPQCSEENSESSRQTSKQIIF